MSDRLQNSHSWLLLHQMKIQYSQWYSWFSYSAHENKLLFCIGPPSPPRIIDCFFRLNKPTYSKSSCELWSGGSTWWTAGNRYPIWHRTHTGRTVGWINMAAQNYYYWAFKTDCTPKWMWTSTQMPSSVSQLAQLEWKPRVFHHCLSLLLNC